MRFRSTTFWAGVVASQRPLTCPKRQLPVTLCATALGGDKLNREDCASNPGVASDLMNQMTNPTGRVQFWLPWSVVRDVRFSPFAGKVEPGSPTDEMIRAYHATRPTYGGWRERPPDKPGTKPPKVKSDVAPDPGCWDTDAQTPDVGNVQFRLKRLKTGQIKGTMIRETEMPTLRQPKLLAERNEQRGAMQGLQKVFQRQAKKVHL